VAIRFHTRTITIRIKEKKTHFTTRKCYKNYYSNNNNNNKLNNIIIIITAIIVLRHIYKLININQFSIKNHMRSSSKIQQPIRSIECREGSPNLMNTIVLKDNIEKKIGTLLKKTLVFFLLSLLCLFPCT